MAILSQKLVTFNEWVRVSGKSPNLHTLARIWNGKMGYMGRHTEEDGTMREYPTRIPYEFTHDEKMGLCVLVECEFWNMIERESRWMIP